MPSKPILAVLGASGVQGSSVIRAILSSPQLSNHFTIHAISRNPVLAQQKQTFSQPISYIQADLNDAASLAAAFSNAHTVFAMTNFWEIFDADTEIQQGRNIADAAVRAGVKHLIWSAQLSPSPISGGKFPVQNMQAKWEVSRYIEAVKGKASANGGDGDEDRGGGLVATYVCVPFYMSNIARLFSFVGADGIREWRFPWDPAKTRVGYVDSGRDIGLFVVGIIEAAQRDLKQVDGRYIHAVSQFLTPAEMCDAFKKVKGQELRFVQVSDEKFATALPEALSAELSAEMGLMREFGVFGPDERDVQSEHDLILPEGSKKSTWETYLKRDWDGDVENSLLPLFT